MHARKRLLVATTDPCLLSDRPAPVRVARTLTRPCLSAVQNIFAALPVLEVDDLCRSLEIGDGALGLAIQVPVGSIEPPISYAARGPAKGHR